LLNDGPHLRAHRTLSIFLGVLEPDRARDLAAFLATLIASASPWRCGCAPRITGSVDRNSMRCMLQRSNASARQSPGAYEFGCKGFR
jgi:hypothetical protein